MRNVQIAIALSFLTFASAVSAKTRISVTALENKAGGGECYWSYYANIGTGMADQLITKLSDTGKYDILERENIHKMYQSEHQLENMDESTAPEKKKFKSAQYTIAGAITSFEFCNKGLGGGVNVGRLVGFGDMRVSAKKASAKVVLDLRVIDVRTGSVLKSVKAEGTASRAGADVSGDVKGVDFGSDGFYATPIGEASRDAISKATDQLAKIIPSSNSVGSAAEENAVSIEANHVLCLKETSCDFVKVFEKKKSGDKVEVFNLSSNKKAMVSQAQVSKIKPIEDGKKLDEGDDVFIQFEGSARLEKCTVLQKSKKKDEVVATCGEKKPASYTTKGAFKLDT